MAILKAGQKLGPYQVESLLGTGGMAEVYRATHLGLDRPVAIKVLNPAFNADPTFPLRFQREAKTVARLSHPHIVTVYDFGEQGRVAYMVMEIAEGGTFRERAARLTTLKEAVDELAPIADALGYAHSKGIVHRDVKPINVLLTEQERSLLADFGLARIAAESLDVDLDEIGAILGTPHYMPPEQVLGDEVDQRADIYALGILTYEVLAGRVPYDGTSAVAVMQQQLKSPPPSIRAAIPEAPEVLEQAILRATAKRPEDRFSSTAEFMAQLHEAAAEMPELQVGLSRSGDARDFDPAAMTMMTPVDLQARLSRMDAAAASDPDEGTLWVRPGSTAEPPPAPLPTPASPNAPLAVAARPLGRLRRRATSFNQAQWLLIITGFIVAVFINVVGLWLTRAGLAAGKGNLLEGLNTYIFHHLGAFKSAMTGLALLLAIGAVISMRAAIIDNRHISPQLYRRLRQYHRLVGWGAIIIAFAVGLLTCVGIFGFGTASPRAVIHSILGTALLVTIVVKIAVVRYYPAQRRYLAWLGQGLLVLFLLVFATSTVPYLWDQVHGGTPKSNPYSPYIGQMAP